MVGAAQAANLQSRASSTVVSFRHEGRAVLPLHLPLVVPLELSRASILRIEVGHQRSYAVEPGQSRRRRASRIAAIVTSLGTSGLKGERPFTGHARSASASPPSETVRPIAAKHGRGLPLSMRGQSGSGTRALATSSILYLHEQCNAESRSSASDSKPWRAAVTAKPWQGRPPMPQRYQADLFSEAPTRLCDRQTRSRPDPCPNR